MHLTAQQLNHAAFLASVGQDVVIDTYGILAMWQRLLFSYDSLGEDRRQEIDRLTAPWRPSDGIPGFHSEHDPEFTRARNVLVAELGLFPGLSCQQSGRPRDTVSFHFPMLAAYRALPDDTQPMRYPEMVLVLGAPLHAHSDKLQKIEDYFQAYRVYWLNEFMAAARSLNLSIPSTSLNSLASEMYELHRMEDASRIAAGLEHR